MKPKRTLASPWKKRARVAVIALVHVLAIAELWRILVRVLPSWRGAGDTSNNVAWVGPLIMSGIGVAIVSVLVLCDDFALQHRFFARCSGSVTARYVVNAICRAVCVVYAILFIAAVCLGYVFFGLFYLAAIHAVDVFLVVIPALRLVDFILWLVERRRGK